LATLQEIFIRRLGFQVNLPIEIVFHITIYKSDFTTSRTPADFWQSICKNALETPVTNGGYSNSIFRKFNMLYSFKEPLN
jgi:hypothetical protein